jgi:uncharacterized protein (TIGR03790 family)
MKSKHLLLLVFYSFGLDVVQPIWADDSGTTNSTKTPPQKLSAEIAVIDRDRILKLADAALALKPPAITDHVATNSAGGLHDFFSQADYAWPNPTNRTGLPYVTRDGESNPGIFTYHRMAMRDMKDAVAALAAAYTLTGDDRYVIKAAAFLRVFFLDPSTRMNPNLQYAQAVLGSSTGREYGVIDTLHLAELPVAIRFLEKSPAFPPPVDQGVKQWFADYSRWITTSVNGVKEMNNANNHSIACFVQLASFAKFTGDEKLLATCRQRFKEVLFPNQMTNNGSFPRELARTKPYGYSIFQADNLATLCVLLSTTNDDLWKITLPDGRTPRNAVDFIYPYLADKNQWLTDGHRKDVEHWEDWPARQPCLIFAYAEFHDEKYFDLWKKLNADPSDLEIRRNLAITQPLLWLANPEEVPLLKQRAHAGNATRRTPDQVLVVFNANSPVSRAIVDDYARKRKVTNMLSVQCQDSALNTENETITFAAYVQSVENPLREYLAAHTNIDFIVLTKGVPIRITGSAMGSCDEHSFAPADVRGHPSVDSTLAALDYTNLLGTLKIDIAGSGAIGCAYSNRYWNASEPFSHTKFGGYLVTRLDGYTEADARALVSRALAAERALTNGTVLLDVQPIFRLGDRLTQPAPIAGTNIPSESTWSEFNADMLHAHDVLTARGISDELDLSETFVGQRSNLLGYFSWGSNDPRFSEHAYQTLFFAPGSLSDTAVSTSARTFLPTRGGQSLLVDLIAHGLTCGKGYVDEPLLQAVASPTIAMERYTSGYTMAESFYAASHFVGWEDVIVGDPLCCPYAKSN